MVNIGIIGCGKIAQVRHLPEYATNPNARLVGYYDKNRDRAVQMAEKYGGKVYGSYYEMLNDPEKLAAANLSQITTAMGTLIDKWAMVQEKTGDNNDDGVMVVIDV